MKVLVVSHACVVDVNQALFRWLERSSDLEIRLVAPRTWRSDLRGPLPFQRLEGLSSKVLLLDPVFSGRGSFHFYRGAARAMDEFRPDLVFLDEEPWSLCALQFAVLARRFSAKLMFYTKENIHRRHPAPFRWIERGLFRVSAAAAVISGEASAVLREKAYDGPAFVLPHGFEPDWFHPRDSATVRRQLGLGEVVIGYIGRLASEKGILDLLRAAADVRARRPDLKFTMLVIGSGPQEADLKAAATNSGLERHVHFLPAVPHNEIASYYNCIDILAVPSRTTPRWKEQFGRVIVEAMASEVCVIGSDSGEIPNVIGDAGLVFREGSTEALAHVLQRLLDDPDLRRELARRGRTRAVQRYRNDVVAEELQTAWRAVLQPCAASAAS